MDNDNTQLCIPKGELRTKILYDNHDAVTVGHPGFDRTYNLLRRRYYWNKIYKDVKQYVTTCRECQRNKADTKATAGLAQPLPIPHGRWEDISMDFVGPLAKTKNKNDCIAVFVDRLTKSAHFIPMSFPVTPKKVARAYLTEIFRHHGMAKTIVSDRDTRFTSKFWKSIHNLLGTKLNMSTADHPQTDGQTERTNRTMEQLLRPYVSLNQTDWDDWLFAAEFAYNNSVHHVTGQTPFYLDSLLEPRLPGQPGTDVVMDKDAKK